MAGSNDLRWKPLDVLGVPPATAEEKGIEEFDVRYGVEAIDCSYEISGNQLVLKSDSTSHAQTTKKKKTKAEIKRKIAEPTNSPAPVSIKAITRKVDEEPDAPDLTKFEPPFLPEWADLNLNSFLLAGLAKLGFDSPTPIQRLCLPAVLVQGKDVLGAAETGSGKTLAYGLPILSSLLDNPPNKDNGLPVLIMTPTRELAMQIVEHLRNVLQETPLNIRPRVEAIVGGIAEQKQDRLLSRKPEIVVATIGRFRDWLSRHDYLARLRHSLRYLVIDEADRMTDKAHISDLVPLIDYLTDADELEGNVEQSKKQKRQTLLFSATLMAGSHAKEEIKSKSRKRYPSGALSLMEILGQRGKPLTCSVKTDNTGSTHVEVVPSQLLRAIGSQEKRDVEGKRLFSTETSAVATVLNRAVPDTISFHRIDCTEQDKEAFLHWIISRSEPGSSILVFVNTIAATKRLLASLALSFPKLSIASLHAKMEQKQRMRHLDRFKGKDGSEKTRILIASDVAARGLDIPDIDTVVHFGIPAHVETFIHRSGRCGRAGRRGTVIALATGFENKLMGKMRSAIAPNHFEDYPTSETELKAIFARVRVCQQLSRLQEELKQAQQDRAWKKRTAEEADIELDSDFEEGDAEDSRGSIKRTLARQQNSERVSQMEYEVSKLKRELAFWQSKRSGRDFGGSEKLRKKVKL